MRKAYVPTDNTKRWLAGLAKASDRGARESCLVVADGEPGLSKTATADWWACQNDGIILRAKYGWTPQWMLADLLEALRIEPAHKVADRFTQALRALQRRGDAAQSMGDKVFAVLLDEADHFVAKEAVLETIRDLSDNLEIPFVLVGMGKIRTKITRYKQIASRVADYVEFQPLSLTGTTAVIRGLAEVEVADDLCAFAHRAAGGFARETMECVKNIEKQGKRNAGAPVTLAAMAGKPLCQDRATGTTVLCP